MNRKISKPLILILIVFIFSLAFATKALSQTSTLHFTFGDGGNPNGNFKFYCQFNYRNQFDDGTIASSGCGPSSIAMVLATYGLKAQPSDNRIADPVSVANLFTKKGLAWQPGSGEKGSKAYSIKEAVFLNSIGLKRAQADIAAGIYGREAPLTAAQIKQIYNYTLSGWYILASAKNWVGCSSCDHTFIIVDANPVKNTITTASPSDCYEQHDSWRYTTSLNALSAKGTKFMSLVPVRLK